MRKVLIFLSLLTLILSVFGYIWIIPLLLILAGLLYVIKNGKTWQIKKPFKVISLITLKLLGLISLAIYLRVFFVEFALIPSASMEDSFQIGDRIVYSKFHYGPLKPNSLKDIPWFGPFSKEPRHYPKTRLKGVREIKRQDVIIFRHPQDENLTIKRIAALSGDTISSVDGVIFLNGVQLDETPGVKKMYFFQNAHKTTIQNLLDSLSLQKSFTELGSGKLYRVELNQKEVGVIQSSLTDKILSLKPYYVNQANDTTRLTFSRAVKSTWGPVIIPRNNIKYRIDEPFIDKYGGLIQRYEDAILSKRGDEFYINERPSEYFLFTNQYYFVLGDNRNNSIDSRHWSLLPQRYIEGKALSL